MNQPKVRACDRCGESDGKIRSVVLQVDGHRKSRRRLCSECRAAAVVAFETAAGPLGRGAS